MKEIDIRLDRDSEVARSAAKLARDLVDAVQLGDSTFMLVMDEVLHLFNRGSEEKRLEGLAYLSVSLVALVLQAAAVGDEIAGREDDFVLAETLRQCRETDFTF
ncbi:MAG: hypothetical protein ACLQBX_05195 [Candidatus Limnocylindrales bacterium]